MAQIAVEMTSDEAKLWRGFQRIVGQQKKMEQGFQRVHRRGQQAGSALTGTFGAAGRSLLTYAGTILSVGTAISGLRTKYASWLENIREISRESELASKQLVAFAALQEGGTKAARVRQAVALGAQFGVTDRGVAFDVVQAMQSAIVKQRPDLSDEQAFRHGLAAATNVFRAGQVGVDLDTAAMLERMGIAGGARPGQFTRMAFVAGQASEQTPQAIGRAGPAMVQFTDKAFGFAVAGQLAATYGADLRTFVQNAGIALQSVSGLAEFYKAQGVAGPESTKLQRLRAIAGAGLTDPESLVRAGLGERRQRDAIINLATNVSALAGIFQEIKTKAVPGLFIEKRAGIEAELPGTRVARENEILRTMLRDEKAFGPRSLEAMQARNLGLARGLAVREAGLTEGMLGVNFMDDEGFAGPLAFRRAQLRQRIMFGSREGLKRIADLESRVNAILSQLERQSDALQQSAADIATAAGSIRRRGGTSLTPAEP